VTVICIKLYGTNTRAFSCVFVGISEWFLILPVVSRLISHVAYQEKLSLTWHLYKQW